MKNINRILVIVILALTTMSFSVTNDSLSKHQEKRLFRKTMKLIYKGYHKEGEANLLKLIEIDSTNIDYNYELGLLYYYDLFQTEKSLPYFLRVKRYIEPDEYPDIYFYLGQAYQFVEEFDKAIDAYTHLEKYITPHDKLLREDVTKFKEECATGKKLADNQEIRIRNLGNRINTPYSEYVPVPVKKDNVLLFTSRRPTVMSTHYGFESKEYYEKVYLSEKKGSKYSFALLSSNFDAFKILGSSKKWHNAIVSTIHQDQTLIIYKRNKLWISNNIDGVWQKPSKVSKIINFSFYQPHASMTEDENKIFFSSWSRKGFGGIDIYYAEKKENGSWSKAKNLGPIINTKYNEDSPEISKDGKTLYFSSKGHNNAGGYDIFKSDYISGEWTEPENMGFPINSPGDDIFFKFNEKGNLAYFSSYRKDGFGNMDIYEAVFGPQFNDCKDVEFADKTDLMIDINTVDTIFPGQEIKLESTLLKPDEYKIVKYFWKQGKNEELGNEYYTCQFDSIGTYPVYLEAEVLNPETKESESYCMLKNINVIAEPILADVSSTGDSTINVLYADNNLTDIVNTDQTNTNINADNNINSNNQTEVTASNPLELNNVYFDFDSYQIRKDAAETLDNNLNLLKENPEVKIKIIAHTDSRGPASYNQILSEKRAKSVKQYLISHGVVSSRIVEVKGEGENNPVNKCKDGVTCTNDDHQLNRRAEIMVF